MLLIDISGYVYSEKERIWTNIGTLKYIENDESLEIVIDVEDLKQNIFIERNEIFEALSVTDRLTSADFSFYSTSVKKLRKRKFIILDCQKVNKFTIKFEGSYYSKILPLILYKLKKQQKYKCFNNFINKYFNINIIDRGQSELKLTNKSIKCRHFYCYEDNKNNEGSDIYLNDNGMIAMINNKTRIIYDEGGD